MNYPLIFITGAVVGINNALWGALKDSPYEGFSWKKIITTVVLAMGIAFGITVVYPIENAVMLFGFTYLLSVFLREYWKSFLRVEDQTKYTIPMAFHIRGRVVTNAWLRFAGALVYVIFLILITVGLFLLGSFDQTRIVWPLYILVGTLGGWISAFGGAWKDAPIEGFQIAKFFRSPIVSLCWSLLLYGFLHSYIAVAYVSLGFTVMTIEFYKSVLSGKTPGKFEGKRILFPMSRQFRTFLLFPYVGTWIYVFYCIFFTR